MSLQHDPLSGLGPGIRTFHLLVADLKLVRGWTKSEDENAPLTSILYFTGTAKSELDGVRDSGSHDIQKTFALTMRSARESTSQWSEYKQVRDFRLKNANLPADSKFCRSLRIQEERFDEDPPTSTLLAMDTEGEARINARCHIECQVQDFILEQLAKDWEKGLTGLSVGIEWCMGYVDNEAAPIGFATNWVLPRMTKESNPEPLLGHVESVSWVPER
jgi:hypothetical protein